MVHGQPTPPDPGIMVVFVLFGKHLEEKLVVLSNLDAGMVWHCFSYVLLPVLVPCPPANRKHLYLESLHLLI